MWSVPMKGIPLGVSRWEEACCIEWKRSRRLDALPVEIHLKGWDAWDDVTSRDDEEHSPPDRLERAPLGAWNQHGPGRGVMEMGAESSIVLL